jgi:hypothetical protein
LQLHGVHPDDAADYDAKGSAEDTYFLDSGWGSENSYADEAFEHGEITLKHANALR